MEAGYGGRAARIAKCLAGRVREISGHPAIPRDEPRHDSRRVQDDLLVGVDASLARPRDRRGVPVAVSLLPVARLGRAFAAAAAVVHFRARRGARRGRPVGGGGWGMVGAGLAERMEVSQYRLATHLLLACLIYVAIIFTARRIDERAAPPQPAPGRIRAGAIALVVLVLAQIYLGALVAGL